MSDSYTHTPDALQEAILALKGVRLVAPFGNWKDAKLLDYPEPQDWIMVGSADDIFRDAKAGAAYAIKILASLRGDWVEAALAVAVASERAPPELRPTTVEVQSVLFTQRDPCF